VPQQWWVVVDMQKYFLFILLIGIVAIPLVIFTSAEPGSAKEITVYKSPDCGCCVGHIAELQMDKWDVNTVSNKVMASSMKDRYNIPYNMQSCHTAVVGDYFVEGHVPLEVIDKLLEERPDIDGIALPGMPAGSPGMPGYKQGPFIIYALSNGQVSEYMRV
jgi:hypothetical protein